MSSDDIAQDRGSEHDHILALGAAVDCIRQNRPDLELLWGSINSRPEHEILDQLWKIPADPQKHLAVTVLGGSRKAPMSCSGWPAPAGVRRYLQDTVTLLRTQGQSSDVADCIEREMLENRLIYWQVSVQVEDVEKGAKPPADCVAIRIYDISDESLTETCIDAVRRADCEAVDQLIQPFGPGALRRFIDAYFELETGLQKSRMIVLLRRNFDPIIHPMLEDFVCGPDMLARDDDMGREAYAEALRKLEGDQSNERFFHYYENDDAIYAAIAERRRATGALSQANDS
jgi:hypothetical protein